MASIFSPLKIKAILIILVLCSPFISRTQTITVEFYLQNKIQKLNNDFSIYFVTFDKDSAKFIIKPYIKNNAFKLPNFKEVKYGNVLFVHGKTIIGSIIHLEFTQNFKLIFGLDKKPFQTSGNIYPVSDIKNNTHIIEYIEFDPQERGDGTVQTIFITNFKKYINGCKDLIK